jgi:hypothetical protein
MPKKKKPTKKAVPARAKSRRKKAALKSNAKKSKLKKSKSKKTAPKSKPKKSAPKQLAKSIEKSREKLRDERSENRIRHSRPGIREISEISAPEDRDFQSAAGGQSGDLQGLSSLADADSESVGELLEEGQALEAEVVSGVENVPDADQGPVRARARRSKPSDFDNEPDPESQT